MYIHNTDEELFLTPSFLPSRHNCSRAWRILTTMSTVSISALLSVSPHSVHSASIHVTVVRLELAKLLVEDNAWYTGCDIHVANTLTSKTAI